MPDRHKQSTSLLILTYFERLHAHMILTASLRESLLETLGRSDTPRALHSWITDALEQNRLQGRYITHILRQHGEKTHDEHETVSSILDVMVSCFPTGEAPLHILSAVLNLAGNIARQRASLSLLRLLAEKQHFTEEETLLTQLKKQSKEISHRLKEALPALLDAPSTI